MAITRSKTTKQAKPKVKRLSKQAPIQSPTEKESIVNDCTGSYGILSVRSSPGLLQKIVKMTVMLKISQTHLI